MEDKTRSDLPIPNSSISDSSIPSLPIDSLIKGRGSANTVQSRFVQARTVAVDDGWGIDPRADDRAPGTELFIDRTKKLITTNKSPDIPFDQSINPYKGCEHGCIYCFARPTHAYLDLSPGLDFETKIFRKSDPREHLLLELSRPSYECSVIAMGTNTDPYQPFERSQRVTREILETLLELRHPVSIVTKSKLILRDLDLLQELAEHDLVQVNISVTTLSNSLKTKLEPRTASLAARLRTVAELRAANIATGVMIAPVIPFINDDEIEALVAAVADAGAQAARYILVRLPLEVAPLFTEWLELHFPDRAKRVLAAIRDTRGGELYKSGWHTRFRGQGQIAELVEARFNKAARAKGLYGRELKPLALDLFNKPARIKPRANDRQMDLF
ncbi:MAG: PA0069 family radical SAM protein [Pseudomonadales bacterium]|nr:PA0069 family radical SAM protein [Pseudomonadales bacterium]